MERLLGKVTRNIFILWNLEKLFSLVLPAKVIYLIEMLKQREWLGLVPVFRHVKSIGV